VYFTRFECSFFRFVVLYFTRFECSLDNYDGAEIAKIALGPPYLLYEEAFTVYKKHKMYPEAMDVLLTNLNSIERGSDFAGMKYE
jgi:hypothetical protein